MEQDNQDQLTNVELMRHTIAVVLGQLQRQHSLTDADMVDCVNDWLTTKATES